MKSPLLWILIMTVLFSCKSKKDNLNYNTNIASITYEEEFAYLEKTIAEYSTLSKVGHYYREQDSMLNKQIAELKSELGEHGHISTQSQDSLFNHFGSILKANPAYLNLESLAALKGQFIKSLSDIDLLNLYFKRGFVAQLSGHKLLPFDMWSIIATVDKWKIKDGETFSMQMNTTAANSTEPAEWYILKDPTKNFTKDNVADTLYPGEFGETTFNTKMYHKGINQIVVLVKLKTAHGEQIVERVIDFTVE